MTYLQKLNELFVGRSYTRKYDPFYFSIYSSLGKNNSFDYIFKALHVSISFHVPLNFILFINTFLFSYFISAS